MRTTVTLDPDVEALLKRTMRERGISFKEALNTAVRTGLSNLRQPDQYKLRPVEMGKPRVPLTKALSVAAELEDEEIVRKLAMRK